MLTNAHRCNGVGSNGFQCDSTDTIQVNDLGIIVWVCADHLANESVTVVTVD